MTNQVHCGDCLELMKGIPDGSVDMILCDLPYGTTQNKWDTIIPLDKLWSHYKRVLKTAGVIALTASQPFSSQLVMSNPKWFKYDWVWEKDNGTGHLNAKKQPLRKHEQILIFYNKQPTYNPQFTEGTAYTQKRGKLNSTNYGSQADGVVTVNSGYRYPTTVLRFNRDKDKLHPTQKPVALFEYLISTYTNAGDLVLDNCCGSGTTAIASRNLGRNWICMDSDLAYCQMTRERLQVPSSNLPEQSS